MNPIIMTTVLTSLIWAIVITIAVMYKRLKTQIEVTEDRVYDSLESERDERIKTDNDNHQALCNALEVVERSIHESIDAERREREQSIEAVYRQIYGICAELESSKSKKTKV